MPYRFASLCCALLLLSGCTTTHVVSFDAADPGDASGALNARARAERARVYFHDGPLIVADGLRVDADSASWIEDGELVRVATHDIRHVQFKNHVQGVVDGFVYGFVYGAGGAALTGALIGLVSYDGPDLLAATRTESAALGGFIFGTLATPVGLFVGGAEGHRHQYVLRPAAQ